MSKSNKPSPLHNSKEGDKYRGPKRQPFGRKKGAQKFLQMMDDTEGTETTVRSIRDSGDSWDDSSVNRGVRVAAMFISAANELSGSPSTNDSDAGGRAAGDTNNNSHSIAADNAVPHCHAREDGQAWDVQLEENAQSNDGQCRGGDCRDRQDSIDAGDGRPRAGGPEGTLGVGDDVVQDEQSDDGGNDSYSSGNFVTQDPPDTDADKRRGKPVRGPTKMKCRGRREYWEPLIELEFDDKGNVNSSNATTFANFCGYAVRKHAPVAVRSWEDVPQSALENIFTEITDNYMIPNDPKVLEKIYQSLGIKFRAYRTRLRRHFDKYRTNEERLRDRPQMLNDKDWQLLVQLFSSDEFQDISNRNRTNRSKQQNFHGAGTSSFAKVANMIKTKEGVSPGKYMLYKKCHLNKYGKPVDSRAKAVMEEIEKVALARDCDLDSAMDEVIRPRKKRKIEVLLETLTNKICEDVGGDCLDGQKTTSVEEDLKKERAKAVFFQNELQKARSKLNSLEDVRISSAAHVAVLKAEVELLRSRSSNSERTGNTHGGISSKSNEARPISNSNDGYSSSDEILAQIAGKARRQL